MGQRIFTIKFYCSFKLRNCLRYLISMKMSYRGAAFALQGDVASPEDVAAMFAAIDARPGRLAGLVNNAGIPS